MLSFASHVPLSNAMPLPDVIEFPFGQFKELCPWVAAVIQERDNFGKIVLGLIMKVDPLAPVQLQCIKIADVVSHHFCPSPAMRRAANANAGRFVAVRTVASQRY